MNSHWFLELLGNVCLLYISKSFIPLPWVRTEKHVTLLIQCSAAFKTLFFVFYIVINIELIRKEMTSMAEPGGDQQRPGPCYTLHIFFCYIDYGIHSPCQSDGLWLSRSLLRCSTMCWIPRPFVTSLLDFLILPKPGWASYNLEPSQGSFYPLVRRCFLSSILLGYCCTQSVI